MTGFFRRLRDRYQETHAVYSEEGAPVLFKSALRQVRRAHILAMACGHLQMIETGFRIVRQAPARFRKGLLILGQQRLLAALAFLKGWGIPHVRH